MNPERTARQIENSVLFSHGSIHHFQNPGGGLLPLLELQCGLTASLVSNGPEQQLHTATLISYPFMSAPPRWFVTPIVQLALASTRGWAANSVNSRIRLKAQLDRDTRYCRSCPAAR